MKELHQQDLAYLQFVEPIAELEKSGILFPDDEYFLDLDVCGYFNPLFENLNTYYLATGAKGQMENLEDICRFIPGLDVFLGWSNLELFKVRDEFLKILNETGSFFHKDLKTFGNQYEKQRVENLIGSLVNYNIIKKEKQGHFIVYKPKD